MRAEGELWLAIDAELVRRLPLEFPDRGLRLYPDADYLARFPAVHAGVGDLLLSSDGDEVTIYFGSFSHLHIGNYDDELSASGRIARHVRRSVDVFLAWRALWWWWSTSAQ